MSAIGTRDPRKTRKAKSQRSFRKDKAVPGVGTCLVCEGTVCAEADSVRQNRIGGPIWVCQDCGLMYRKQPSAGKRAVRPTVEAEATTCAEHPMQPLVMEDGIVRFKRNAIIDRLVFREQTISLNKIAQWISSGAVSAEDAEQFWQLLGYSVSAYGTMSFVRPETVAKADKLEKDLEDELLRRADATLASAKRGGTAP